MSSEKIVNDILEFYLADGAYGVESLVTQVEHACQAAKLVCAYFEL